MFSLRLPDVEYDYSTVQQPTFIPTPNPTPVPSPSQPLFLPPSSNHPIPSFVHNRVNDNTHHKVEEKIVKGERGEKGDKGDKGDKGNPCYVIFIQETKINDTYTPLSKYLLNPATTLMAFEYIINNSVNVSFAFFDVISGEQLSDTYNNNKSVYGHVDVQLNVSSPSIVELRCKHTYEEDNEMNEDEYRSDEVILHGANIYFEKKS